MKITLTRNGGFTGITLKKTIDTKTLAPEKAKEIEDLVTAVADAPPAAPRQTGLSRLTRSNEAEEKPSPDRFTYTISIQNDILSHSVKIPEESLNTEMRKIIDFIHKF